LYHNLEPPLHCCLVGLAKLLLYQVVDTLDNVEVRNKQEWSGPVSVWP